MSRTQPSPEHAPASGPGAGARAIYLDAFRGLMALAMVQGHVMDSLLTREALAQPLYVLQQSFHGLTAPGFLFASGFVAGLPRAPLSLRAGLRRARRLLFVLGVGYYLHLPYFSLWKTLGASTARERALLFACDALQVIAATQLFVLLLQWLAGPRWTRLAGVLALLVVLAAPAVWSSGLSARLPEPLAPWLDDKTGSEFPVFPFSAFVLAGTLAGALVGHADPARRRSLLVRAGLALLLAGGLLAIPLSGRVDFWGPSPAYSLGRLGALLLLLRAIEGLIGTSPGPSRALALLGRETLTVYVLHLTLLYGGVVFGPTALSRLHGTLGFGGALLVLAAMLPLLYAAAWLWRTLKHRYPREAHLLLVFVSVAFLYEFAVRPW